MPAWPWFSLASQGAQLAADAQQVILLRLSKLAIGGRKGRREASRMVSEKVTALGAAQRLMLGAATRGRAGNGAKSVISLYRKRVAANKRRLSKR